MGFAKAHDRLHALCSALRALCRTLCTCPARALHASLRALHPFLHPTPGSGRADACAVRHGQGQLPQAGHRRVGLPGGGGQRRCTATAERELLCEYSAPAVASAPSAPCLCAHCSPLQPLRALQPLHSLPSAPSTPPLVPPVPSCALGSLCILCPLPLVPFAGGRRGWPAEGPLRLRPGVLAGHMPLAPTWLGLGPTRRGSNPTPTFTRLSASAFTRRPSFSRSCIRPAGADMRQRAVLQCCRKNGRGKGWLGQEQDALARWVLSTRAGDHIDSVQHPPPYCTPLLLLIATVHSNHLPRSPSRSACVYL